LGGIIGVLRGWGVPGRCGSGEEDGESWVGCLGPVGDAGDSVVTVSFGGSQDAGDDALDDSTVLGAVATPDSAVYDG